MTLNSVELYHEEFGQGTPVIFLHGFPFDHTLWQPLVPLLQKEARLLLPDLRGAGQSPVPEGVYSMRDMAEDVVRLMDRLGIEKAVLVGHSMGGYISLAFAHAYLSRLSGLALVSTQSAADLSEKRQSRLKSAASVKRYGIKKLVEGMLLKLTTREAVIPGLRTMMMRSAPVAVVGALKGMAERADMTDALAQIAVPSVVIAGTDDQIIPLEQARTMAQLLPMSWGVEIAGTGHVPMLEEPQQVAEALRPLLQRAAQNHKAEKAD